MSSSPPPPSPLVPPTAPAAFVLVLAVVDEDEVSENVVALDGRVVIWVSEEKVDVV